MVFNNSKLHDFPPEFSFSNGELLECVEQYRLLGIQIQSNLKWDAHVNFICRKAMGKLWLLRRMKALSLDKEIIIDYYVKEIRPITEHGVIVWNSGLTAGQVKQLEKIQKLAFIIILGFNTTYTEACQTLSLDTLHERRKNLCTNFAIKLYKSEQKHDFFRFPSKGTRMSHNLVIQPLVRTKRAQNAPHVYLSKLINENKSNLAQMQS